MGRPLLAPGASTGSAMRPGRNGGSGRQLGGGAIELPAHGGGGRVQRLSPTPARYGLLSQLPKLVKERQRRCAPPVLPPPAAEGADQEEPGGHAAACDGLLDPKTNHAMTVILMDLRPNARQQVKVIHEGPAPTGSGWFTAAVALAAHPRMRPRLVW